MRNAARTRILGPVARLPGAIALAAIAVAAMSAPLAADERGQSTSKDCIKTLTEKYGATEFSNVNDRFRNSRRSVYLDARLENGKNVRMRCLFRGGGVSEVQAYEEPGIGASESWPSWGPADRYRLPEDAVKETDSESTDTEVAATPGEPEPGTQPSDQPAEESAEQPAGNADEEAGDRAGDQAADEADVQAEAGEEPEPQFGVRKKAPQ